MLCSSYSDSADEYCVPDTVPAVLREADTDKDGQLSLEEFSTLLHTSAAEKLEFFASRTLGKGQVRRLSGMKP